MAVADTRAGRPQGAPPYLNVIRSANAFRLKSNSNSSERVPVIIPFICSRTPFMGDLV